MHHYRVKDPSSNGYYSWLRLGDFEYANPIDKLIEIVVGVSSGIDRDMLHVLKDNYKFSALCEKYPEVIERVLQKNSLKQWERFTRNLLSQRLPDNILNILNSSSYKEEIKILKGVSLSIDQLLLFIVKAYEDYGYTISKYFPTIVQTISTLKKCQSLLIMMRKRRRLISLVKQL